MINNIKTFAKFLDQPILISKLNKTMPKILLGTALLSSSKNAYDVFIKDKQTTSEDKKKFFKNSLILLASCLSAIYAPKIASRITNREIIPSVDKVKKQNEQLINEFIKNTNLDKKTIELLEESKNKVLSYSKVKLLLENLRKTNSNNFINKLIPEPENITSKDIFSEIGYLSIYGAIPVIGGVGAGVALDKIIPNKEDDKNKTADKISEGLYQYLANIFLCNVGAGAALGILEKLKITNKTTRAIAMLAGIVLTGVVGGSKIANYISKKFISPFLKNDVKERTPEIIDLGMHTDDIATVATLSGLKWIEPSLPFLYALSGYKSGIGYRN